MVREMCEKGVQLIIEGKNRGLVDVEFVVAELGE